MEVHGFDRLEDIDRYSMRIFFYILFFCMSATTQDSKESCDVAETSDGSARMDQETGLSKVDTSVESEKPTEVTARSAGPVTDDELSDLSEDDRTREITHQIALLTLSYLKTPSDNDSDFNPDLPTRVAGRDQTPLAKDGVVGSDKPEADKREI